jgi:glycerophosphoryl diester phosphodiesterase
MSGDGELVLWHDPTRNGAPVARSPRRDLATLEEALELCRGKTVNVEVKADLPRRLALVSEVSRVVSRARDVDIVVSSFDPAIVLAFVAAAPRIPRAMLVGTRTPRLAIALPTALRRFLVAAHLQDELITPSVAKRIRALGLRLCAWTVNDEKRGRKLAELGASWLITDEPSLFVSPG